MSYKKSVDITIEQFFIDRKKEIIDTYNNNLLESIFEERNGLKRVTPEVQTNIEIQKTVDNEEVKKLSSK